MRGLRRPTHPPSGPVRARRRPKTTSPGQGPCLGANGAAPGGAARAVRRRVRGLGRPPGHLRGLHRASARWGDVTREAARRGWGGSPCRSGHPGTWRVRAGRRRCDGLVRGRARPHHRRHHRPAVATDSWSAVIRSAIDPASAWPSTVARAVRPRCPRYRGQDFTMPPPARDGQPQCRVFALRILESPAHALKVPRSAGPQRQGNRDADGCREARGAGHQDLPPP